MSLTTHRTPSTACTNADGTLDPSFGDNGAGEGTNGVVVGGINFAVQPDSKILAYSQGRLRRLTADGQLDQSFPLRQIGDTFDIWEMFPLASGKIILFGTAAGKGWGLMRLNSNGTTDTFYGTHGLVVLSPVGGGQALVQRHAGADQGDRVAIAGSQHLCATDRERLVGCV